MVNSDVDGDLKSYGLELAKFYENSISGLLTNPFNDPPRTHQLLDLQDTKAKLEKELNEAKTALSGCCQQVDDLQEELERLKGLTEELSNRDHVLARKKADLENEYSLLSKAKVNSHDEDLLETTKFQYKCVRNMTQIRFSYTKCNDDVLEGTVFNKVTKKLTSFSLDISSLNEEQIQERLMKLMKDISHPSYSGAAPE